MGEPACHVIHDPVAGDWVAVKLYADENPTILGRFGTQREAEICADVERENSPKESRHD